MNNDTTIADLLETLERGSTSELQNKIVAAQAANTVRALLELLELFPEQVKLGFTGEIIELVW